MVSLVDIVPQTRTVEIGAGELKLRGLGLRHIAELLLRFPELRKLWIDGAPVLDIEVLIETAPDAIGTIIAEAASQPEAAGNISLSLSLEDVFECLIVIRELTMPGGVNPLVERLGRLLGADDAQVGKAAATSMPRQPSNSSHPATVPAT